MTLFDKLASFFNRRSDNNLTVALTITKTDGNLSNASVDYIVNGKFVNIKQFNNITDAARLFDSYTQRG